MTETTQRIDPETLERGRYRLAVAPDGGWIVTRAVETCERCQSCGCGDQAEPIMVPAMVVKLAHSRSGMLSKLRAVTGHGDGATGES